MFSRKLLATLVAVGTVITAELALAAPASANVPQLIAGPGPGGASNCIGVVLDFDGVYNHPATGGGWDAVLCNPQGTSSFGWTHAGGYYIPANTCFDEFDTSTGNLIRHIPKHTPYTRQLSSAITYTINRVSC
jgi:hypothetical protein